MKNLLTAAYAVFLIGSVDNIEDGLAAVEITDSNYKTRFVDIPIELFPCEIGEGDMFYFSNVDGVTEIRCGEPGEQTGDKMIGIIGSATFACLWLVAGTAMVMIFSND